MNSNNYFKDTRPLMVSIQCITYNHEPYIRQCLDGFVMQKTNFRFEAVVHDDASTDGTADIIREYAEKYPDIIKPIFETENQYSKHDGSLRRIMDETCKGKYIAMCEGDDYWIDPQKLQIQVDFMESHPDYSASIHNAYHVDTYGNIINTYKIEPKDGSVPTESFILGGGDFCATNSILYRMSVKRSAPKEVFSQYVGDYPLQMYLAFVGKVYYFSKVMSAYRIGVQGSWSNRQYYMKNFEDRKKIWVKEKKLLNDMDRISEYKYHKLFLQKYYRTVFSDSVRYKKMFLARYYWFKIDHPMVLYGIKNFRYVFGGYEFSLLKEYVKHICRWMAGQQKA